jgi:hypothetical protein
MARNLQIILPALVGHVPDAMVHCVASLLDFAYLARRSSHDTTTLKQMNTCLSRFHTFRQIFETSNIRPDGFDLPRQHSLVHYVEAIFLFGSPNGLCSSITESKHIDAVKKPWRRSRRYKALLFVLRVNTRMSKLAAARSEFGRRGMLASTLTEDARNEVARNAVRHLLRTELELDSDSDAEWEYGAFDDPNPIREQLDDIDNDTDFNSKEDVGDVDGPMVDQTVVMLSVRSGVWHVCIYLIFH